MQPTSIIMGDWPLGANAAMTTEPERFARAMQRFDAVNATDPDAKAFPYALMHLAIAVLYVLFIVPFLA